MSTSLRLTDPAGRRLLATAVTGSGLVFLDGTVANVALPRIGTELDAELAGLQWVVNGYTLALASLILVGGSLGDRLGRKRVFGWGTVGITWALTAWPGQGALAAAVVGVVAGVAFVVAQRHASHPMTPPQLFASRVFTVINVVTLFVYAALAGSMFFLAVYLQVTAGWTPLEAGAATVPVSVVMLFLASWFGGYAARHGARTPMVDGALVLAAGLALLALAPDRPNFLLHILPGVLLQGFGLSMLVAPLTGTVLAAVPDSRSGVASGINNAVSRTAGLLAIAALPLLVGLSGDDYRIPHKVADAYRASMWWCAGWVLVGAALTFVGLRPDGQRR
ncbi:MFS transporter [Yimella sp. RIT 621]|uniref:MFS transporter n=1 Tax=Yimella sp. RIT 621 TaxID=2510323 RepID=UPI001459FE79|nr:MFS transporter [Yimella sp. RIT 621]